MTISETTVPFMQTVEEAVRYFLSKPELPTVDDLEKAMSGVGRNSAPELLFYLYCYRRVTPGAAARLVSSAWCGCEFPSLSLDKATWRKLFDLAGYTAEGVPAERPVASLRLYRGALPGHHRGWSWTDDLELARWFAQRPCNRGEGRVWAATVRPARLLARISEQRPGESEYVVDARRLVVAEEGER